MRAQKRATEVALSCMESLRQSVALVFHLLLDQITNGGRTGDQHFLLAQILHGFLLVLDVLGLDRQADDAGLAVNTDDLGFDFVADVQHVARIFNAVTADFGGLQGTFDVVTQGNYRTLGVNFLDGTGNDAAFLVQGNEVGERIVFQLLDTQGDALTLRINGQDDGFQLVALLEAAYGFFASLVPGDVGQVNQTVDAAIQTDEDAEVGDGLDGTGDLVALVELAGELFPGVQDRKSTRLNSSHVRISYAVFCLKKKKQHKL